MKNTGNTTWSTAGGYKLGSQNPENGTTWGLNRVALPGNVIPGQTVTFSFNITAPAAAGTYNFQWRIVREGIAWIGPVDAERGDHGERGCSTAATAASASPGR